MVKTITVINLAVFVLWLSGTGLLSALNLEVSVGFLQRNFLVSWEALAEGRWWVLLTSVFSHSMALHFLINMLVLNNFGGIMERLLGAWSFLRFYLVAGVAGSFAHAFVSNWFLGAPDLPALGASGAIAGLILAFCLIFPRERIYLFGFIPIRAIWGAVGFIALDLWGLISQIEGGGLPIGHGAHLGGAFVGVFYFFAFFRPRKRRHPNISSFSTS